MELPECERKRYEDLKPKATGKKNMGALIDRLEEVWEAFDSTVDWGQDCMGYAMPQWGWKYGDSWREDEAKAIAGKVELKNIIIELRRWYETAMPML